MTTKTQPLTAPPARRLRLALLCAAGAVCILIGLVAYAVWPREL